MLYTVKRHLKIRSEDFVLLLKWFFAFFSDKVNAIVEAFYVYTLYNGFTFRKWPPEKMFKINVYLQGGTFYRCLSPPKGEGVNITSNWIIFTE